MQAQGTDASSSGIVQKQGSLGMILPPPSVSNCYHPLLVPGNKKYHLEGLMLPL